MKPSTPASLQQLRNKTFATLQQLVPAETPTHLTTEYLARILLVKPGTIRRSLCTLGHYQGLIPIKMSNGRLLWEVRP